MGFLAIFDNTSKVFILFIGFAFISAIGVVDFLTGYEFAFSVFYVLPIAFVTWFTNRQVGLVVSFASTLAWLAADVYSGHPYSHHLIPVWNASIRLGFFVIITLLLSSLRKATDREKALSRIDNLTGAVNSRLFYHLVEKEIDHFKKNRHPFSLAYIDLDNFKFVNDQFGHPEGDQVLRAVVSSTRKYLREIDVVARLGGDEFALLLPETDEEGARSNLAKIQDGLLEEMCMGKWPVTFSIGVLTCRAIPHKVDDLIKIADELMYSVKHDSKNGLQFSTYANPRS